ncbi:MAG: hypothetical protein WAX69_17305 [Victivallales bacterium]
MKKWMLVMVALCVYGLVSVASAGTITWNTPQNITGDSDVSTNGVFNRAYIFDGMAGKTTTVNGVTFSQFRDQTTDTKTLFYVPNNPAIFDSGNSPFVNLSSSYKRMLASGMWKSNGGTPTVTLSNLVAGNYYEVQIWVNDPRGTGPRTMTVSGSGAILYSVAGNTKGVPGQFMIGSFKADATSQKLSFNAVVGGTPQINGMQLREITAPPAITPTIPAP